MSKSLLFLYVMVLGTIAGLCASQNDEGLQAAGIVFATLAFCAFIYWCYRLLEDS